MKKNKSKYFWYMIGISCLLIFSLMLVSSVLNIGERLRKVHIALEFSFYGLVVFVIFFLIINPIRIIVSSPSFSICTTLDEDNHKVRKVYRRVAKNLLKLDDVDDSHKELLTKYKNYNELKLNLQIVFNDCVKGKINEIIIKNAKTVLISTAICQNARMDMFTVFSVNLNMIKEEVQRCGFRPSMKNLSKLTLNVFTTALIAEGLESLSLEDVLPNSANNFLSEIPLIKPVMASVTQGIANALLTIRIGCVTRKYLFKDGNIITKEDIRKQAFKDSLLLLPQVVYGTLTFVPKKILHFFTKTKKEKSDTKKESANDLKLISQ